MADRGNIPNSPACGLWETLLADALDGLLRPEDEATFSSHMAVCPSCTALFEEARRGREWLEFLSPEPEVPEGLLDKILAQTGPGHISDYKLATAGQCYTDGDSGVAAARNGRAGSPLCGAAAADDGGDGFLLDRADAEHDRRQAGKLADFESAADGGAFFHGAQVNDGLNADYSLLRSPEAGVRSSVADAGDTPQRANSGATTAAKTDSAGDAGGVKTKP